MGDGGFSVVKKGFGKGDKFPVAIKEIKKAKVGSEDVKREVDIWKLASTNSARVVKLFDIYEDSENIYLVMELMKGGELFDKIVNMQDYSERYASTIIKQVLSVIKDLHKVDIVHQDMKPENLLLEDKESSIIKLCDFGLAEIAADDMELIGLAGSTPYMAPEVVAGSGHSKPVDLYATGVISYIMLCGYPPFEPENGIIELEFPSPEWDMISDVAKDIIAKLLVSNPDVRPTAEEALRHPWFKDVETIKMPVKPLFRTMNTLKRYQEMKGNPTASMREYRGQRGSVMDIFKEEPIKETTIVEQSESLSESGSSNQLEEILNNFKTELLKSKEKLNAVRTETSALKVKMVELSAIRSEVEMRVMWEINMVKKDLEEDKKRTKKLSDLLLANKNAASKAPSKKTPIPKPSNK
uniref:Protein kinase domain-containing protein n=1 Tax=Arcella intermedia TaxID=1963864 RepID=A0A6B2L5H9_9EUKA